MPSYCCFLDPVGDYTEKSLEDLSPAGQKYGFPIFNAPKEIDEFKVIKALSRGFYGATYVVQDDLLQKKVLKVIPVKVYKTFKKDFHEECTNHARIAAGTEHIVGINRKLSPVNILFPEIAEIECHVAVLDYVNGETLENIMDEETMLEPSKIAQMAIDLLRLLEELNNKQINHNDLHAGNLILKELEEGNRRADELNNYIKVIAIDLGSLSEESKSDNTRIGDINRISLYLQILSKKLLKLPKDSNDNAYKLAYLLDEQARLMSAQVENQTLIGFNDAIEAIKETFRKTYYPWKIPLKLKNFADSYNAQTLQPWYVPSLIVDPDDKWINSISNKGPLLITGMRGCGKTMLLRALEFHARAVPANNKEESNKAILLERLKNETYVGLYVSSRKLLDKLGKDSKEPLFEPFSRLFISYALEGIRAIRHLQDINQEFVVPSYFKTIKEVLNNSLSNKEILQNVQSESSLENILVDIMFSLNKGEDFYRIDLAPSNAFQGLAEAIRNSTTIWQSHYILFLLDDVSTRYFHQNNIAELLSSLIFQNEICAFKITSEAQTIEVILNSPGNIEKARLGRDVESFDLGQNVYGRIKDKGLKNGTNFIEEILIKRADYYSNHPNHKPSEMLGSNTLINVARTICNISEGNDLKNKVYYGMTTLAGICVGDIGEVIHLYDSILKHYDNKFPISPEKQSRCFRDLSSTRLFQLNRFKSDYRLKDFALSFAEASHELLKRSYKYTPKRLRQYYCIYITISSGSKEEQDKQFDKLIELIDAGIFVFAGGSQNPRLPNSMTNPVKQFVLLYRKLYGITNLIGLQQADRFELNGDNLVEFLANPKKGKEILMRGLDHKGTIINESPKGDYKLLVGESKQAELELFEQNQDNNGFQYSLETQKFLHEKTPNVKFFQGEDFQSMTFDYLILGLGFEERALATIQDFFQQNGKAKKAICINYSEKGQSKSILNLLERNNIEFEIAEHDFYLENKNLAVFENKNILCCVSGLSKGLIFNLINNLYLKNKIVFSHTYAENYYPLDSDIQKFLTKYDRSEYNYELLEQMTAELVKGEKGPYIPFQMHNSNSDESKKKSTHCFFIAKI
jgi:tRNA A-37 threonylcarbamoyl transferase component Bud32